ncbi:MAG: hypothetical protein LBQ59_02810 [Candidatus Peribacteria bacterium]|nr:hypothetical protein [Candidatus Peribacteria bacterium]
MIFNQLIKLLKSIQSSEITFKIANTQEIFVLLCGQLSKIFLSSETFFQFI